MIDLLLLTIALTALGWFLTGRIRRWARRRAVLDVPNSRSVHDRPMPTGGGLVIVGLCLIGLTVATAWGLLELDRRLVGYLIAAGLIAAIGWADDLHPLSSRLRLAVQALAVSILLAVCPHWNQIELPWLGTCRLEYWGLPITFLWLVGLTNAYNFMDGLDGLAAALAVVAAAAWILLAGLTGQPAIGLLALLLLAGSAGFLVHNRPPARVFMGDVGSTFLGFTFAALGVMATVEQPRLALASALVVWPFVFDAGITFLRRLTRGENVFIPHRTHLYQRLIAAGWSANKVLMLYLGLAMVGLLLAVGFAVEPSLGRPAVLILPLLAGGLWWLVRRREAWAATRTRTPAAAACPADLARHKPFRVRVRAAEPQPEHATQPERVKQRTD